MKQYITIEQLNELNKEQLVKFYTWVESKSYQRDLISIGQLIEFLDKRKFPTYWISAIGKDAGREGTYYPSAKELCNALWEAVKEILNETKKT